MKPCLLHWWRRRLRSNNQRTEEFMSGVFEVQHPLIACHLTRLRDKTTPPAEFRQLVNRLASLLAYEATKDLRAEPVTVQTPLAKTEGRRLAQRIGLIPILRAGLGMIDPVLELIPTAEVWHLGLVSRRRDGQAGEVLLEAAAGAAGRRGADSRSDAGDRRLGRRRADDAPRLGRAAREAAVADRGRRRREAGRVGVSRTRRFTSARSTPI